MSKSSKPNLAVCRFFNAPGGCREGKNCRWLHVAGEAPPPQQAHHEHLKFVPCKFFYSQTGCIKGDMCPYSHELKVPITSISSIATEEIGKDKAAEEETGMPDCSICLEVVVHPNQFGLLNKCDHTFCLNCIRQWRQNKNESKNHLTCPLCRTRSDYVVPSMIFATGDLKQQITDNYIKHLKTIPCKKFNYGEGACTFGTNCFYAHLLKDGSESSDPHGKAYHPRHSRNTCPILALTELFGRDILRLIRDYPYEQLDILLDQLAREDVIIRGGSPSDESEDEDEDESAYYFHDSTDDEDYYRPPSYPSYRHGFEYVSDSDSDDYLYIPHY